MNMSINFPNLHISLERVGKTISIGNFDIAYYGLTLAFAMMAGLWVVLREAKRSGQNQDDYFDLAIIAIICSLIGARIYYVIFAWDKYKDNPLQVFNLRQGGLAIYGGVIAAIITTFIFCKKRKMKFPLVCDTAGLGLITGQIIGRWGNFFNRECFGGYTDNLLAMQLPVDAVRRGEITESIAAHILTIDGVDYIQVHPTFLYESLWNLVLLLFLLWYIRRKRFDGEVFLLYLFGYGVGRFWVESLRTDQLLIPGLGIPVSMVVGAVMAVVSAVWIIVMRRKVAKSGGNDKGQGTADAPAGAGAKKTE
ncbi:MAG: prolipoprotein diacylglyceryl transferase [Lachnospiraceae bacterium]|nr:prolipoprotein diacylglyceryl transferase [Lachnospiraceae bacterium]MDD7177907.1 prolipoprotein diacylglyceryl transferase [bacterium]MDY5517295.1 prolipoprotein diacylglyceryl transferase [Lachnospiraceae bacterium]